MRYILRILNNFNFDFTVFDEKLFFDEIINFSIFFDSFKSHDWRDKLIGSFYCALFNREEFKDEIKELFFIETNSRQLKGYVICIMNFYSKDEAINIFMKFLEVNDSSYEKDWVLAAKSILEGTRLSDKYYDKINKLNIGNELIKRFKSTTR